MLFLRFSFGAIAFTNCNCISVYLYLYFCCLFEKKKIWNKKKNSKSIKCFLPITHISYALQQILKISCYDSILAFAHENLTKIGKYTILLREWTCDCLQRRYFLRNINAQKNYSNRYRNLSHVTWLYFCFRFFDNDWEHQIHSVHLLWVVIGWLIR